MNRRFSLLAFLDDLSGLGRAIVKAFLLNVQARIMLQHFICLYIHMPNLNIGFCFYLFCGFKVFIINQAPAKS